jgi:uncharacterized protein
MNSANIFYGSDGKLRSGWRFAIFVLAFLFFGLVFGTAAVAIMTAASGPTQPGSGTVLFVNGVVSLAVALIVGWLCGKYLESLPFEALGASLNRRWAPHLLAGLAGGAITFAVGAGIGVLTGGLSFSTNSAATTESIISTLVVSFLIFAAAAAFEEALFRGYILQTFIRSDLALFGVLLTSTLFATVHNANPSATTLSWINTFIAGVWFAVAYLKTRDLWLPTGLHLAWNWTQGSIFGVEVSGLKEIVRAPLMRESDAGPAWLTGGDYGIEGGVVTTIALVVSTVAILFVPYKSSETAGSQSSEFQL